MGVNVTSIKAAGLIPEWNDENPQHRVGVGDSLLRVNNATTCQTMQAELKSAATSQVTPVILVFRRHGVFMTSDYKQHEQIPMCQLHRDKQDGCLQSDSCWCCFVNSYKCRDSHK